MNAASLLHREPSADKLARARQAAARASRLQGDGLSGHRIEVIPSLAGVLPLGGLQVGATYSVTGSTALLAALLAAPSSAGLWCGLVGLPHFAAESARDVGCDLDRVVMVPDPGDDWVNVVAALVDALPVVVTRPLAAVPTAQANRLAARLRQRGGVLLVAGGWPRAEVDLRVRAREWRGLGPGHGRLRSQRIRLDVEGRGALRAGGTATSYDVWLPDEQGNVRVEQLARTQLRDVELIQAAG